MCITLIIKLFNLNPTGFNFCTVFFTFAVCDGGGGGGGGGLILEGIFVFVFNLFGRNVSQ